jgi:hypothetical protein
MKADRFVAVVGSRELPPVWAAQVAQVVGFFVGRGWGVGSGGARGADQYALEAVLHAGSAACGRSVIFLPGAHSAAPGSALRGFVALGGRVVPGTGVGRAALLGRSGRLARASSGVVAFLWGPSRGSVFTVREAIRAGKPAAVVLAGGGAALPAFSGGAWVACSLGGVAAFRWQAADREPEPVEAKPTPLARVFVVPDGEPTQAVMAHISSLSPGERRWFEEAVLVGDTVLMSHERLSDTPAFLALPRLRRRFGCTVRDAAGLAELFLALEAGPDIVSYYVLEARRRSVGAVIEDLVHLVAQLALVEDSASTDLVNEALALGDAVEHVSSAGELAPHLVQEDGDSALLAWHAVGSVRAERIVCGQCGQPYDGDEEAAEIPACPVCGVRDTWEARQCEPFRSLVAEIDACSSLELLRTLGKRLYALRLSHEQAGVAWTYYTLRKVALEAAVPLGAVGRALLEEVERAPVGRLAALGARLYRVQHAGAEVSAVEWRRIWQAYQRRRATRAA